MILTLRTGKGNQRAIKVMRNGYQEEFLVYQLSFYEILGILERMQGINCMECRIVEDLVPK